MTDVSPAPAIDYGQTIIAKPDWWYRGKHLLIACAAILAGLWFIRDGFYEWPRQNEVAHQKGAEHLPHSNIDLLLQRAIAVILPPLGVFIALRATYYSRGEYRLDG